MVQQFLVLKYCCIYCLLLNTTMKIKYFEHALRNGQLYMKMGPVGVKDRRLNLTFSVHLEYCSDDTRESSSGVALNHVHLLQAHE